MKYTVRYKKSVKKELAKLPKHVYVRVTAKLLALGKGPRPHGCRKLKGSVNEYRLRIGDYRILYTIADDILTVFVIRISDRKDWYR